jgi:hypothetical protein
MVYIHVDVEQWTQLWDIANLCCTIMDADLQVVGEFNEYVKLPKNAEWDPHACRLHGLHIHHPSIVNADSVLAVWPWFKSKVEE